MALLKLSKYGTFSGPYFPLFGLNTEIYVVNFYFGKGVGIQKYNR